jgi:hypothetical protein
MTIHLPSRDLMAEVRAEHRALRARERDQSEDFATKLATGAAVDMAKQGDAGEQNILASGDLEQEKNKPAAQIEAHAAKSAEVIVGKGTVWEALDQATTDGAGKSRFSTGVDRPGSERGSTADQVEAAPPQGQARLRSELAHPLPTTAASRPDELRSSEFVG